MLVLRMCEGKTFDYGYDYAEDNKMTTPPLGFDSVRGTEHDMDWASKVSTYDTNCKRIMERYGAENGSQLVVWDNTRVLIEGVIRFRVPRFDGEL